MPETAYDIEQWATRTTLGRRLFNHNFRMTGRELPGFELLKVTTMQDSPSLTERVYLWSKKASKGRELVRIGVSELHHWRLAQGELHAQLQHSMRPEIPEQSGERTVGDVSFAAQAPRTTVTSSVFFTRGNLVLHVASVGDKPCDVSGAAKRVDELLSELPPPAASAARPRAATSITVTRKQVALTAAGPSTVQALAGSEATAGWVTIIAPDGELSREGERVVYVSPHAGKRQVRVITH